MASASCWPHRQLRECPLPSSPTVNSGSVYVVRKFKIRDRALMSVTMKVWSVAAATFRNVSRRPLAKHLTQRTEITGVDQASDFWF